MKIDTMKFFITTEFLFLSLCHVQLAMGDTPQVEAWVKGQVAFARSQINREGVIYTRIDSQKTVLQKRIPCRFLKVNIRENATIDSVAILPINAKDHGNVVIYLNSHELYGINFANRIDFVHDPFNDLLVPLKMVDSWNRHRFEIEKRELAESSAHKDAERRAEEEARAAELARLDLERKNAERRAEEEARAAELVRLDLERKNAERRADEVARAAELARLDQERKDAERRADEEAKAAELARLDQERKDAERRADEVAGAAELARSNLLQVEDTRKSEESEQRAKDLVSDQSISKSILYRIRPEIRSFLSPLWFGSFERL